MTKKNITAFPAGPESCFKIW